MGQLNIDPFSLGVMPSCNQWVQASAACLDLFNSNIFPRSVHSCLAVRSSIFVGSTRCVFASRFSSNAWFQSSTSGRATNQQRTYMIGSPMHSQPWIAFSLEGSLGNQPTTLSFVLLCLLDRLWVSSFALLCPLR